MMIRHDNHEGRRTEAQCKLDEAISTLERSIKIAEDRGESPPEDILAALEQARSVRHLLDTKPPSLAPSMQLITYSLKLAREIFRTINELLNCTLSGALARGGRTHHQTA